MIALAALAGCRAGRSDPPLWPARADQVVERGSDTYLGYDLDADGRLDYLQRLHDGYKDRLYFPVSAGGALHEVVTRPAGDPSHRPLLVLLLDGVAYERLRALYDAGRFRLFRPPALLVSVFPTLTDPAYDLLFGTGPTTAYEAGYFDRAANRLSNGISVYLRGANERWAHYSDYRLNLMEDAFMYLMPRAVYSSELRRARDVLDRRLKAGARSVVIYLLSTDALGHMLQPAEIESELARLDDWVERTVYEYRGQIEIVMMADHGMSAPDLAGEHLSLWDLPRVLRDAGVQLTDRLERPGDVVLPQFGLLDVARLYTYDAATRHQVSEVLRQRDEVEVLAVCDADTVQVYAKAQAATIRCRTDGQGSLQYSYEPAQGDPLGLSDACTALRAAGLMDAAGFASVRAWLDATADHAFPAAPQRLWEGFFSITREQPDIVLSLNERFYAGSGLFSRVTHMHGTHGGLHHRSTVTFVMTTSVPARSPCDLPAVGELLRGQFGWEPTLRR